MSRVHALITVALMAALATALPARAERLSLDVISDYVEGIGSASARFTQIAADGAISTGDLAIRRPGRVRFDYDPPNDGLVLASAGAVYIIDRKVGGTPETYPLSRTPLSIILARDVDLTRSGMVTGHAYDGTATLVTARDPQRPDAGTITLKFTHDPVELRQWVIETEEGGATTVILDTLRDAELPDTLFRPDRANE